MNFQGFRSEYNGVSVGLGEAAEPRAAVPGLLHVRPLDGQPLRIRRTSGVQKRASARVRSVQPGSRSGPIGLDVRHNVVVNASYDLPFSGSRFTEGWQHETRRSFASGVPFPDHPRRFRSRCQHGQCEPARCRRVSRPNRPAAAPRTTGSTQRRLFFPAPGSEGTPAATSCRVLDLRPSTCPSSRCSGWPEEEPADSSGGVQSAEPRELRYSVQRSGWRSALRRDGARIPTAGKIFRDVNRRARGAMRCGPFHHEPPFLVSRLHPATESPRHHATQFIFVPRSLRVTVFRFSLWCPSNEAL